MSVASFELIATKRFVAGKLANRRLRREQNQIPAILYGGKEPSENITLDHNKLLQITEHEGFYSKILTLIIDGHKQKVVLKDLQRHPFKPKILHLDFQRVKETDVITMRVPLHFIGVEKCPGVKLGGIVLHNVNDLEIRCQAQYLPEFIEVDLSKVELGQIIHLSELKLPTNVEIPVLQHKAGAAIDKSIDTAVVSVQIPKAFEEPVATEAAAATTEDNKDAKDAAAKDSKDKVKAAPSDKKDKK